LIWGRLRLRTTVAFTEQPIFRCAIYTRKSSEHGLEQDFNSLDAKREAGESNIKSQAHEGCSHPEIGSHPGNPGLLIAANAIVASETRHACRCGARELFGCARRGRAKMSLRHFHFWNKRIEPRTEIDTTRSYGMDFLMDSVRLFLESIRNTEQQVANPFWLLTAQADLKND